MGRIRKRRARGIFGWTTRPMPSAIAIALGIGLVVQPKIPLARLFRIRPMTVKTFV